MEEVIKYFESLEARIAALEARMDQIEQKQQLGADGFEQIKGIMSKMGANILGIQQFLKEAQLQKEAKGERLEAKEPRVEPIVEPEPEVSEPVVGIEPEEPQEAKSERLEAKVEQASPKAAVYGKAVGDIRLAISLGDRFLYQRELFGQNAELMQKTLTKLNEMHSFDEALAFISKNFNWDTESNTYQQFLVTLHRRFG
jgi:hypothetical protein